MEPFLVTEQSQEISISELLEFKLTNPTSSENSSEEENEIIVNSQAERLQNETKNLEEMTGRRTKASPHSLDKYGFILNVDSEGHACEEKNGRRPDPDPSPVDLKQTERREKKWNVMLDNWDRQRPKLISKRLRKGVPDSVRGKVWAHLSGGIRKKGLYQEIVQKTSDAMLENYRERAEKAMEDAESRSNPSSPMCMQPTLSPSESRRKNKKAKDTFSNFVAFRSIQDTIERDIHRTYPRHYLFYEEERNREAVQDTTHPLLQGLCDPELASLILNLESDIKITASGGSKQLLTSSNVGNTPGGQAALRRVLRAYSYYDREVGYCQGMNFIAGMFLTMMTEEEAFWLLVATMHDKPCIMRGLFGEGMHETHKVLHVAESLTHQYLPKLAKHFDKENIHVTMYATQWLLTQYTSSFNFDLVTRVWDCFLGEGWKIIYRVMLALLQQHQTQLLKMSFEEILAFFRELPDNVTGHAVIETALKIPLRTKFITKYEDEWYKKQEER